MKAMTFVLFLILALTVAMANGLPMMERSADIEGGGCFDLRWTVDLEARMLQVSFRSFPGSEYVGFGVSEYGSMKGADIMVVKMIEAATGEGPKFFVEDLISTEFAKPRKDILQNVELLHATLDAENRIYAVLERPLDSCDKDDIAIEAYKQNVICASGSLDAEGEIMYHSHRSSTLVNFMVDEDALYMGSLELSDSGGFVNTRNLDATGIVKARASGSKDPLDSLSPIAIDVQMPNITLPTHKTSSFFCTPFRMPSNLTIRAVGVESVWGNGQVRSRAVQPMHIHHQALLSCEGVPQYHDLPEGVPFDCSDAMPPCRLVGGSARTPLTQYPPGLHAAIESGYVCLI